MRRSGALLKLAAVVEYTALFVFGIVWPIWYMVTHPRAPQYQLWLVPITLIMYACAVAGGYAAYAVLLKRMPRKAATPWVTAALIAGPFCAVGCPFLLIWFVPVHPFILGALGFFLPFVLMVLLASSQVQSR